MIEIGNFIYELAPTGEWLKVGKVVTGIDYDYVTWYP
jgi:hypothetical protein